MERSGSSWRRAVVAAALAVTVRLVAVTAAESIDVDAPPSCDLGSALAPVRGELRQRDLGLPAEKRAWEFALDAGCSYRLYERPQIADCLSGKWVVLIGASQTNIWTVQLANTLAHNALITKRDGFSIDGVFTLLIDVVIEDGKVVYKNIVQDRRKKGERRVGAHTKERDSTLLQDVFSQVWRQSVKYSTKAVRITNFFAEYWDNVDMALHAVESASGWARAPVTMAVTIGLWYVNSLHCAESSQWCATRPAYGRLSMDELLDQYREDMLDAMARLEPFCSSSGRARVLGCAVASIDHCQFMQGDIWHRTYDELRTVMSERATHLFRYIDLWTLTMQIPEDCLGGHQSPMSALWTWQVLLGGICQKTPAAKGALAAFHGPLCRAEQVNAECDDPHKKGFSYSWECALSELCTLEAVPRPAGMRSAHVSAGTVSVDFAAAAGAVRRRTWLDDYRDTCAGGVGLFTELLLTLLLAGAAAAILYWLRRSGAEGWSFQGYKRMSSGSLQRRDNADKQADSTGHLWGSGSPNSRTASWGPDQKGSFSRIQLVSASAVGGTGGVWYDMESEQQVTDARIMVSGHRATGQEALGPKAKPAASPGDGELGAAPAPPASEKFAFGLARCVASLHVVAGHLYARQAVADIYLFGWGFTWVPWFFMLSGFILFSAEARRPRSESVLSYVSRRLVSIYPLYAVSLLAAFVIAKTQGVAPSFPVLLLQVWLAQAWVPLITERTLQMQCWFISCLVVYWVAFRPLFGCVSRLKSLSGVVSCMIVLYLLPWLAVSLPAIAGDAEWYEEHTFGRLDSPLDFVVVFLKFHPLCYVHVFILGLLLARFRELLEPFAKHVAVANVMQVLAPLGYLGLLLVFCLPALRPPGAKLSARLSVLLPLQSAVLLGLAGLPGAELPFVAAKAAQLNFLEGYSYAVYVMQFICYHLWPAAQAGPIFFAFLAAVAVVAVHAVQRPAEALWQRHRACAWLTPVALTGLLGVLSALPEPTRNTDLPAFRELEDLVVDVRLSLLAEGEDSGGRQGAALINPSMLFRDNGAEAVFAARRHRRTSERSPGFYDGRSVTVVEEIWHSEVVLGTLVLDDVAWSSWLRGGTPVEVRDLHRWSGLRTVTSSRWVHLCVRERWIPENNTLVRLVVTGPEDAKVFQRFPDVIGAPGISVAFNSYPPLGRYGCGQDQAVSQMYLAEGVDPRYPRNKSYGIRLDCGHQDRAEKNWIPFQHEGRLHFVYSVLPHVVAEARSDGRCGNRFYSSFAPLVKLQAEHPGLALRGSAQAVRVDDPDATPRLPKAHYLALLHIVDPKTHRYAHFAYRFKAEAPFDILQVSSQLPLMAAEPDEGGPSFAFASGLALRGQQIVVTYAAGDRDPRALVMPLQRLDAMFATDVAPGQAAGSLAAAASFGGELRPASF